MDLGDISRDETGRPYDLVEVVRWLIAAVSGQPVSEEEARSVIEQARAYAEEQVS